MLMMSSVNVEAFRLLFGRTSGELVSGFLTTAELSSMAVMLLCFRSEALLQLVLLLAIMFAVVVIRIVALLARCGSLF